MIGDYALVGGALEVAVPSYALRLVRRHGAERIGWFVVIAFSSLAALHLVAPLIPMGAHTVWRVMPDAIYAVGSALLLIGMGHLATLLSEREQANESEVRLKSSLELRIEQEGADLANSNQELLAQIARREQIEKVLRESETQYRYLFTENPQPMWIVDLRSSRFLAANKAALRQYGFTAEEFMALAVRDLVPRASLSRFLQFVAQAVPGVEARGKWQHHRKDGMPMDVQITAVDVHYAGASAKLVLAEDIGPYRRRELESRQAQKMEVIGRVAGGVAHHFNNILTIIQGHASIMLNQTQNSKTTEHLTHISAAATRAAGLTRQLLAVGSRHPMQLESLDLNGLIREQTHMLRRLVGESIVLQNDCGNDRALVLADRYLVEYLLINLVLNARDATPAGGTITFSTATVRFDKSQVQDNQDAKAGEFVRLAIRDTGCGMTPEIQAHLFEPFFTTKDVGKGAGLGLAGVYGAVKQQSGWVESTSDVGVGTEFRVFLPIAPAAEAVAQMEAKVATPAMKCTILLVEPEDRARGLARCVLNWSDYRVIEADNSATALMLWSGQASNVDILLTDVNLPDGVSGHELANQLLKMKPSLKVLFTSGSAPGGAGQNPAQFESWEFISKPYTPDKLIQAVRSCLAPG